MKKIILIFLSLGILIVGRAQVPGSTNNIVKVTSITGWTKYSTIDGLPSNAIKDVIFDNNGVLWIATSSGVSKFNGTTFQNYTVSDGLHSNAIGRLYCDNQNRVWAMGDYSSPGLSVYDNSWQTFSLNALITSPGYLFQNSTNDIYIAAGQGCIYKYNGSTIDSLFQTPDKRISSAVFDPNGNLWLVSGEKLLKYSGNTLEENKTLSSNGVGSTYIIDKDKLGKLWIIMGNSLYKSDDFSTFNILGTTSSNYYWDLAFDSKNNLYLARYSKASGGIKTYNGTTWGEYTGINGLTSATVQAVAIASNDIVWAGADDGLYRSSTTITGIKNVQNNNYSINIYPALGKFRIVGLNEIANVSVMDMNGKILLSKQLNGDEELSINSLPKGLYFVKLVTSGNTVVKRFIKD